MDSLLEKITLYDILGYLFPGSVLVMMILVSYREWMLETLYEFRDNAGILYFAFIITSYLVGIAASEAAGVVIKIMEFINKKASLIIQNMRSKERVKDKSVEKQEKNNFWEDQMISALKKSGVRDDESKIRDNINKKFTKQYMSYMYGILQSDPDYKRIHNYNSAYVMYKNMAIILVVGTAIMYLNHAANNYVYISCFIIWTLFVVRCFRFSEKTRKYTIVWFSDRYNEQKGERGM